MNPWVKAQEAEHQTQTGLERSVSLYITQVPTLLCVEASAEGLTSIPRCGKNKYYIGATTHNCVHREPGV